eukprot:127973_1
MTNPHISIPPRKSKPKQEAPSVYYISTNSQRCIHSADALLQGLYPLQNRSEDSSIPIHCDVANTWLYPNPTCKRSVKQRMKNEAHLTENDDADMIAIKQKLCTFYDIEIDRSWLFLCESLTCRLNYGIDLPPSDVITEHEMKQFIEYVSSRMCKLHCLDRSSMRLSVGILFNKFYNILCHFFFPDHISFLPSIV